MGEARVELRVIVSLQYASFLQELGIGIYGGGLGYDITVVDRNTFRQCEIDDLFRETNLLAPHFYRRVLVRQDKVDRFDDGGDQILNKLGALLYKVNAGIDAVANIVPGLDGKNFFRLDQNLRGAGGDRLTYEQLEPRAIRISVSEVSVRLAGLGDIIESKRFADREKDREALPELERLLSEQE